MGLLNDEQFLVMEQSLIEDRKKLLVRQEELLKSFRIFAHRKFRQLGKPFSVKYRLVNGKRNLKYEDLEIGSKVNVEISSFVFNPQTSVLSNNSSIFYEGKKLSPDLDADMKDPSNMFLKQSIKDHKLEECGKYRRSMLISIIEKRVDHILEGIFNGDLVFSGEEFKRLMAEKYAIEQELERLNTRIGELTISNINGFEQDENSKAK